MNTQFVIRKLALLSLTADSLQNHEIDALESAIYAIEAEGDNVLDTLDILMSQLDFPNNVAVLRMIEDVTACICEHDASPKTLLVTNPDYEIVK